MLSSVEHLLDGAKCCLGYWRQKADERLGNPPTKLTESL